ncbi:UNVERIFIED_CONTAM: Alcohol-forming fatty acyl-CoA reductase [Sesamum calycinum]|uniref:Fatty acyl-CoA reductase n=1 Tax=Sesamum calycinum TaxID=2727403 RepID=A0AAW2SE12_9LAMI
MEQLGSILQFLENRSILVTGATGFLAKIFVEKILRVQPNVRKLYLLLRAPDAKTAMLRFNTEVMGKDLFRVVKEKYGGNLNSLISEKVKVVAGDITCENLGVKDTVLLQEMWKEVDVVVNLAANTNFDERYDVSLAINTLGAKHVLNFSKKCDKLKVHVHVSTEKRLVDDTLKQLKAENCSEEFIKSAMKDLGIQRTIDSLAVGYGKGRITCFLGNPKTIIDAIPADMVVNAMIVAMVAHANQPNETIYHVGSSVSNPLELGSVQDYGQRYFTKHPWINKEGRPVIVGEVKMLNSMDSFKRYLAIHYLLPLKGLQIVNTACCQYFESLYVDLRRKIKFVMRLVELYGPYLFFKGYYDDMNSEILRRAAVESGVETDIFYFDPKVINWADYFMNIHLPGAKDNRVTFDPWNTERMSEYDVLLTL